MKMFNRDEHLPFAPQNHQIKKLLSDIEEVMTTIQKKNEKYALFAFALIQDHDLKMRESTTSWMQGYELLKIISFLGGHRDQVIDQPHT